MNRFNYFCFIVLLKWWTASFLLLAVVEGAPQELINNNDIQVLRYENNRNEADQYKFEYELSNGQTHSESGTLKEIGEEKIPVIVVVGRYSFVGPDGQTYHVEYTADENGFHPIVGIGAARLPEISGGGLGISQDTLKSLVG